MLKVKNNFEKFVKMPFPKNKSRTIKEILFKKLVNGYI